jgi:putative transposase
MSVVAENLGVARSNLIKQTQSQSSRSRGRPPLPDAALVEEIKAVIAAMPTYGYRRVQAALARRAHEQGRAAPNHKRVYRVMKAHGLLLQRNRPFKAALRSLSRCVSLHR